MKKQMISKRGRGRPRLEEPDQTSLVTREAIVDLAYEQSRTQSLDSVSFVQLAKELGVVPGSLHYHIGTKDDLVSAVLNRYYKDLLERLERIPSDIGWRERIRRYAYILMESERDHRGAAEHIQTKSKFRVFQKVGAGETDYGALYLDQIFTMFREAGFDASQTALYYHVLALHCLSSANSANTRMEPAGHEKFLTERAAAYASGSMPGLEFALPAFARVRTDDSFQIGLEALLDCFADARITTATGRGLETTPSD